MRCGFILVILMLSACHDPADDIIANATIPLPERIDFNYHIKPILSDRCFACHGPDANKRKAGLRLDEEESAFGELADHPGHAALVARSTRRSQLFQRIVTKDTSLLMPPPAENLSLSDQEKALLAKWIQQGAEYKPHWSFVLPQKNKLPDVADSESSLQPLDHYIQHKLALQGLSHSKEEDRTTLLRRATLDLTGLPPTPEEIVAFLADESTEAYEKVLDRLLQSDSYGERLALEWLDVARYADSHGYQDDGMRNTWPWRDWVIKAFNQNMPYDQFLLEQLAGDLLPNATRDQILATCFNRNHPQSQEGGVVEEEYRIEYVADRTNTLGKGLLGLTMECARCHDHKYDPISQEDYYSLFAFFNNNNDSGIVPYNGEATPTVMLPTEEEENQLQSLRAQMQPLEAKLIADQYREELSEWLAARKRTINLDEGLVAQFDFEKELEVPKASLRLDGEKGAGWAGVGDEGKAVSYLNKAKGKADAAILGDPEKKPQLTDGKHGRGLLFVGDAGVRFNRDLDFDRHQPFSVSLWVKLLAAGEKGPIFNNTNGDFEGYRGWICKLNEDATLSFQMNHVWPDNCIDYQTTDPIALREWVHIAYTYDGSSKANGLRFYVDGVTPKYTLHRDNLKKSLLHGVDGSNWSSFPFMLGREKERSIENVVMDQLRVYDRELSTIEIQSLHQEKIPSPQDEQQWMDYYLRSGKNKIYHRALTELTALRAEENKIATDVLEVMVMGDRSEVRPTFILDRGMYDAPMSPVEPKVPAVLASFVEEQPSNRLGLARWVVSEKNPLTARVQVNRLWMMLFGKGLVATQEDFGNQGNLPSHPGLLDWLAVEFMEKNWDIKAMLKMIMMSATYRQSSVTSVEAQDSDPLNTLYSRFPAFRLPAEVIRDNALAASGLLVKEIGGPSVYPYQPKGIWKALATRNATEYHVGEGQDLYRRSMYTVWKRSAPPPAMMNFDAPDRYYCIVNRQKTATPLQSLVLMNDPQFVEAARALAQKSLELAPQSKVDQINFIFQSLISRSPLLEELKEVEAYYILELEDLQGDSDRRDDLLSVGQFEIDKDLDQSEMGAMTMVASMIMNYDEFVMKR